MRPTLIFRTFTIFDSLSLFLVKTWYFITVSCHSLVTLEVCKPIEFHQAPFSDKVKVKLAVEQATKAQRGCRAIPVLFSLTSALDVGWVINATPRPLDPQERPGTLCTGGWVGARAGLDGCGKSRLYRDSIPGPSRP